MGVGNMDLITIFCDNDDTNDDELLIKFFLSNWTAVTVQCHKNKCCS